MTRPKGESLQVTCKVRDSSGLIFEWSVGPVCDRTGTSQQNRPVTNPVVENTGLARSTKMYGEFPAPILRKACSVSPIRVRKSGSGCEPLRQAHPSRPGISAHPK
jgi:hypothetical protein